MRSVKTCLYVFYEYFVYREKNSPKNTVFNPKTALIGEIFCVFLFYRLFCLFGGELHLHKCRCNNGRADHGFDDLGHHVPAVIDEREHPL